MAAQLMPLVLASRQYSARLEMYRQLVEQLHPAASQHEVRLHGAACMSLMLQTQGGGTPKYLAFTHAGVGSPLCDTCNAAYAAKA